MMSDPACFLLCNPNRPSTVVEIQRRADSTIAELKQHLQATYPGLPAPSSQRLIFEGRLLGDDERLREVLASSRLPASEPRRMHLAIRGQSATTETHTSADDGTPKSSQQNQRPSSSTPPLPSSSPPRLTNHLPAQHPAILAPQPAHTSAMHTYGSNGVYGYPYAPAAYQYPPFGYPSSYSSYPSYPAAATVAAMAAVSSIDPHDAFGLRQRHARSDGSASSLSHPVATPAQLEAHAHAMSVYQQQLQQYHAMCAAMTQQLWPHNQTAGISQPAGYPSSAGANSIRHSPVMSSNTAASAAAASANSHAHTSGPPAGSILAALTTPQPPPPQQPPSQSKQQRQQQLHEAEEAIRAYIQQARAAAATQPAAAAPGPVAAAGNPAPAGAAAAAPAVPAAGAAAVAPAAAVAVPNRFGRYINVQLMAKFVVIFVLFSQGGDAHRAVLLAIASVLAYLHQVGAFRAGGPPAVVARAGGGAGGLLGADEDDEMEFAMAGRGGGGGGGMAAGQIPPVNEPPRAPAPQAAAQVHAQAPVAHGPAGVAAVAAGAVPAPAAVAVAVGPPVSPPSGFVVSVEKFIVGLFASLVPSWRPVPVPMAVPPPQPPQPQQAQQAQHAAVDPAQQPAAQEQPQAMEAH